MIVLPFGKSRRKGSLSGIGANETAASVDRYLKFKIHDSATAWSNDARGKSRDDLYNDAIDR